MNVPLSTAFAFVLVLFRTAGLFVSAPVISLRAVPMRARVAMAALVAWVAFSGGGFPSASIPSSFLGLAMAVIVETLVGLLAGLGSRVMLEAATAAGQVAAVSMGFGYGAMLDPINGVESTALGQLFNLVAVGVAVSLGLHREALGWLSLSVTQVPPGSLHGVTELLQGAALQSMYAMVLVVRLTLPLLAAITFGHAALGIVSRVAPQIQLASVGFSVAILAGGGAIYVLLPGVAQLAAEAAVHSFSRR